MAAPVVMLPEDGTRNVPRARRKASGSDGPSVQERPRQGASELRLDQPALESIGDALHERLLELGSGATGGK